MKNFIDLTMSGRVRVSIDVEEIIALSETDGNNLFVYVRGVPNPFKVAGGYDSISSKFLNLLKNRLEVA